MVPYLFVRFIIHIFSNKWIRDIDLYKGLLLVIFPHLIMSKLNIRLHFLVIYAILIARRIHGGGLNPTNQKVYIFIYGHTYMINIFS
jgi:hypothetical protein